MERGAGCDFQTQISRNGTMVSARPGVRTRHGCIETRFEDDAFSAAETRSDKTTAELRDLLSTLDLGITMARDPDGTIRHWSKGCQHLYGWTSEEAIGRVSNELLCTIFPVPFSTIEAALRRDGQWTGELRHHTRDGRELLVNARKVLRRDAAGSPLAVMESITDLTAQRAAEAKVTEQRLQLAHAAKMDALGQLAGGMAHDFNNVLQIIQVSIEHAAMLQAQGRSSTGHLLKLANQTAARGAAVSHRLLAFARQSRLQATAILPATLLTDLTDMLQPTLGPTLKWLVHAAPSLPLLLADLGQLEAVLVNLVNNASDAMVRGGTLVLHAAAVTVPMTAAQPSKLSPGAYICISVTDNGIGMSPEVLARITEPFFTTKPRGKGTGLGLAMARGFAEQSGGNLTVVSSPELGTTVSIYLPQANQGNAVTQTPQGPPLVDSEAVLSDSRACCLTVLLVDDEEDLRNVLAESLAYRGYRVEVAGSVEEALSLLDQGLIPDALITDLMMPGRLTGIDLLHEMRSRCPRLPMMLITGYVTGHEERMLAEAEHSDDFVLLRKPVSVQTITVHLRNTLDVHEQQQRGAECRMLS